MHDQFIHALSCNLSEVLDADTLKTVITRVQIFSTEYNIEKKCTEVAVNVSYPQELKSFLVTRKIEGMSDESLKLYNTYLYEFMRYVGGKPVSQITVDDIRAYLYHVQQDRGISNRTLRSRQTIVASFMEWCANEGYTTHNPCRSIKPIKYSYKPREPLTDVEMELLRAACETDRDRAMVEFFYSTGCRVTEVVNLRASDINFMSKEVNVFGKGQKWRPTYLNAKAEVTLRQYLQNRPPLTDGSLFCSERKPYKGLGKRAIEDRIHDLGVKAGIERNVFPHLIRHTMATDALNRKMDITEVQMLLGHSNINTTMVYAHVDRERTKVDHRRVLA